MTSTSFATRKFANEKTLDRIRAYVANNPRRWVDAPENIWRAVVPREGGFEIRRCKPPDLWAALGEKETAPRRQKRRAQLTAATNHRWTARSPCERASCSEFVVHAGADDVVGEVVCCERHRMRRRRREYHSVEIGTIVAEVDVEVLELGGPILPECPFEASAHRPAAQTVRVAE